MGYRMDTGSNNYEVGEDFGDIEEIVGATAPLSYRPPQQMMQRPQGQVQVQRIQRQRFRELVLPLSSAAAIAAGAAATVSTVAQEMFRARRLVVDPTAAASFTIQDVKVGNRSQLIASGTLPATMFMATAVGVGLRGDTARVGQTVSVNVTNTSGGGVIFLAGVIGDSVM